jgi:large subunit ribosomal protein L14
MIQVGTLLNASDNSGAKKVICIKVYKKKAKIASVGDLILVSVKSLRNCRKGLIRIKKGEMYLALVVKTKVFKSSIKTTTRQTFFLQNSVILLNKQKKLIGTRVIGPLLKDLRYTKYLRVVSICSGLL